jgi:energy-coupling factor transport system substrate-specific component
LFNIFGIALEVEAAGKRASDLSQDGYANILYDNTNGLPTSEANDIVETKDGIIWIGSYSGLIKYDGKDFERVDSTTGISSVVRLFVDTKNRLWIGTNDNGVAVMEKGKFTFFNITNGLKSSSIRSIVEDSKENIYVATTNGIAYIDKKMKIHSMDDSEIRDVYTRSLVMGKDDVAYGITMDGDVYTLKDHKLERFYPVADLQIKGARAIGLDEKKNGIIYLGTKDSEIYRVNMNNGLEIVDQMDVAPLSSINKIKGYEGNLWVCADNGISFQQDGEFVHLDNLPMDNAIENIMVDYQGNLWFTSSRQGVLKIVPSRFSDIFERYHLKDEVVNSTCLYNDDLYIGKDKGLTVIHDKAVADSLWMKSIKTASGRKIKQRDLLKLLEDIKIRSIICAKDNTLWISTFSKYGLISVKESEVVCYTEEDGMPSSRVRAVAESKDGSLLAACTGGVAVVRDGKVETIYNDKSGITNTEVLTVCETKDGDRIIGTDGGGIFVLRGDKVEHIDQKSGLSSGIIMRLKYDEKRDLTWVVTSNAIGVLTSDYKVKMLNKFPYSNNFDMYESSKGEMWILSSNGVYVIETGKLLKNHKSTPMFYNKENGLQVIATANSYSCLGPNGDLYIAGSTGVSKVNIENDFENVDKIKVGIQYINVDGKKVYPNKNNVFKLDSDAKRVTFYLGVYTYSLINPKVTVSLRGFGDKKSTVSRSDLSPIVYTNLKGGKYSFDVEVVSSNGEEVKKYSFDVVKKKAIYEHMWFNIFLLLSLINVAVFLIHRKYKQKTDEIRKKAEEQKLLIGEIVEAFAKTIDMKDKYTNGHSGRVAAYTSLLARELGYDEETVWKYYNIALMHDIGKIGIPESVLNKPGKLTDEEYEIMKQHTVLGYNALKDISIMPEIAVGAGAHHERWDGKGYPRGIKGDEIPRVAQVIAVADTFDAMYSTRPYRKRMPFEKVVSIIRDAAGTQLTADVVDAFLRLVDKGYFKAPDEEE